MSNSIRVGFFLSLPLQGELLTFYILPSSQHVETCLPVFLIVSYNLSKRIGNLFYTFFRKGWQEIFKPKHKVPMNSKSKQIELCDSWVLLACKSNLEVYFQIPSPQSTLLMLSWMTSAPNLPLGNRTSKHAGNQCMIFEDLGGNFGRLDLYQLILALQVCVMGNSLVGP